MKNNDLIRDVLSESPNRRSLLKKFGMATAALGAVTAIGSKAQAQAAGPSIFDVLNFALNLEYLESEFYTVATTGNRIDAAPYSIPISFANGVGVAGVTTGGAAVSFTNNLVFSQQIALEIAQDERDHVVLLQNALTTAPGGYVVNKPAIYLDALAGAGAGFGSLAEFLILARIFEDIGVTAYAGATAVPSVAASGPYLTVAAQILAAEAEHVGNIRLQCVRLGIASPMLDSLDYPPTANQFISVNATTGLASTRTPGQVLVLAYGAENATGGGFFPNGVNGPINTSSTKA